MKLIYEKNSIIRLFDLVNRRLDSLLKVTSVLCAGYHTGKVKTDNLFILENFRNVAICNFKRKSFGNSRFTYARFTDKNGIVLCTT